MTGPISPRLSRRQAVTVCPHCDRETRTIRGVCPNCGQAKANAGLARQLAEPKPTRSYFWGSLDDLLVWGMLLIPAVVIFVGAVLWLGMELLFALAVVAVVIGTVASFLGLIEW